MINNYLLIHQDSGDTDYYTPIQYPQLARAVMGRIDFDPASSWAANTGDGRFFGVRAESFYEQPPYRVVGEINGLPLHAFAPGGESKAWWGNVWMNHPFGHEERPCADDCTKKRCLQRGWHTATAIAGNRQWVETAVGRYERGEIDQLMLICFAAVNASWFRPLLKYPMLVPTGRVNYYRCVEGQVQKTVGNTKDSVVFYLGKNVRDFIELSAKLGTVKL